MYIIAFLLWRVWSNKLKCHYCQRAINQLKSTMYTHHKQRWASIETVKKAAHIFFFALYRCVTIRIFSFPFSFSLFSFSLLWHPLTKVACSSSFFSIDRSVGLLCVCVCLTVSFRNRRKMFVDLIILMMFTVRSIQITEKFAPFFVLSSSWAFQMKPNQNWCSWFFTSFLRLQES